MNCKFCNKECKNLNSLTQHELRCKCNPNRRAFNSLGNYSTTVKKGQTKQTNEVIAKQAETLKQRYANGSIEPASKGKSGTFLGRRHSEESKRLIGEHVSMSRKQGYASGRIKPAKGVGRGKYSYIVTPSKTYMLRSTYEFVFALYLLLIEKVDFELEAIKVPAIRENIYGNTFLSDFSIDDTIIEIKGIPSGKDYYIKESFEAAGYKFIELFEDSISRLKVKLTDSGVDIDSLLNKIVDGHNSGDYFKYYI